MKGPIKFALSVTLAIAASQAFALGLGTIRIKSGLNQPLLAEIPVETDSAAEAEGLRADLASAEEFQRVGLNRARVTVPIEFTVVDDGHGQKVIRLTTKDAVREPFLDFLLEANWSRGKLLREYTILLDPPVTAPAVLAGTAKPIEKPKPVEAAPQAPVSQPREETSKPVAQTEPAPAPRPVSAAPAPAAAPASSPRTSEYTVQRGDTLSQVAYEHVDDPRDYNRMLLALFKANPRAFSGNINRMKAGAVLRIPSSTDVRAIGSLRDAMAAVRAQNQAWREESAATLVANAGAAPAKEEKAAAKKAGSEHLALVPPSGVGDESSSSRGGSGSGGKEGAALRADLARTKEALSSREQEATELKSRVSELEEINNKSQRLISLKDSEIAELQNKLKQIEGTKAGAAKPAAAASPPASADAGAASAPAPSEPAPAAASPSSSTAASAPPASAPTPPAASAPAAPKPAVSANKPAPSAAKPAPSSPDKPWYVDYLSDNPYALYGIGGVLALIVIGLLARMFARKKVNPRPRSAVADAAPEEDIHVEPEQHETGHSHDDAQAPAVAPPQPRMQPGAEGSGTERLRHHFGDGDADSFGAFARTLHDELPEDPTVWHETPQPARQSPNRVFVEPTQAVQDEHPLDQFLFEKDQPNAQEQAVFEPEASGRDAQTQVLFDPDTPPVADPRAKSTNEPRPASRNLPELEFEHDLHKQLDLEQPEPVKGEAAVEHPAASLLDEDVIGTRLDLARAYLDMGDAEGAHSMLDEVIAEGNQAQKDEARKLLSELS
jgi:pilus assembly protein FimV